MINVALCSYGMSGKVFHAPLISAEPRLKLHSILQRGEPTALRDFSTLNCVKNFEDIIANPDIDLVVVNTPNALHFPMAHAALAAGKHVVVEKPFTLSLVEGSRLIGLAEEQNKILSVFQNKRLESDYLDAQRIIASGKLGRIVEVEWHYDRYRVDITHKLWKENNLPGAGTWFDLGIHLVDSMLCLFGKPCAVYADMRSLRRTEAAVDYFNVCFHYPDMRVNLRSNTYVSEKQANVAIHGDKGSFLKFGSDVQEAQLVAGLRPGMLGWAEQGKDNICIMSSYADGQHSRVITAGGQGCYENYYRNVAAAIRGEAQLEFKAPLSLLGVEMLLAAQQSFQQQRLLSW